MNLSTICNWVFGIAFVLVIIGYWYFFLQHLLNKRNDIRMLLNKITKYNNDNIVNDYENFNLDLLNCEIISQIWVKYKNTLTQSRVNDSMKIFSTVESEEFFNVSDIVSDLSIHFWQNLAGIFTGLGILGTFVGLTIGLLNIDMTSNASLQKGIGNLLSGTSTAFGTSVAGLILALGFNGIHNWLMKKFSNDVELLANKINGLFTRTSVEDILFESLNEYKEQTKSLKAFSTELAISIGDALDNTIKTEFKPVFEELRDVLEALNDGGIKQLSASIDEKTGTALKEFAETLSTLQIGMQTILENSQRVNEENSHKMQMVVSEATTALQNSTTESVKKQNESLNQILLQIQDVFAELNREITSTSKQLQSSSEETNKRFQGTLKGATVATQNIVDALNNSVQSISDMLDSSDKIVQCASETADKFAEAGKPISNIASKLGNQMSQVIEASNKFNQNIKDNTQILNDTTSKNLKTYSQLQDMLTKTEAEWHAYENHFKGVSGELENTFSKLQNAIESYNGATQSNLEKNLHSFDHQIKAAISQINTLVEELNEPIQDLTKYLENKKGR